MDSKLITKSYHQIKKKSCILGQYIYYIVVGFSRGNEISSLEEAKRRIDECLEGKLSYLRRLQQGALSDDVFGLKYVQDYISGFKGSCLGYLGQSRTSTTDKRLEEYRPGSKSEFGQFLCSKGYRDLQDENYNFVKITPELVEKAFIDRVKRFKEE